MTCPRCGAECWHDEVDVGIGIMHGPYGCPSCGWCQDPAYDLSETGPRLHESGYEIDQWGGLTPPQIRESEIRR